MMEKIENKRKLSSFVGDRSFYKMVFIVAIPMMVQNGITNFVNLLDNIMVGKVGTEQMSAVSIVNQLIFVYALCIFGGFSGAGIFTAQYNGLGDNAGIRETCRYKLKLGIIITLITFCLFSFFDKKLISLYLNEGSSGNLQATLDYAQSYLWHVIWSIPFFMFVQVYSSTLRECGETVAPMKAGFFAVVVNLVFNWLLIYGNLGFPRLGVVGAAIATVLSRIVEAVYIVVWTHSNKHRFPFIEGLYSTIHVKKNIRNRINIVGSPLLLNETLWSAGMAMLVQCYSMRGLDSVAGFNILATLNNFFKVVFISLGNTVGIIVGRHLGARKMDEAVDSARKLTVFSVFICFFVGAFMLSVSKAFPLLYNTTANAKQIATQAIIIAAIFMPLDAFKNATYFTLRSGGRTIITLLFDGIYVWLVSVPLAFVLSRYSQLTSVQIFFWVCAIDIVKATIGFLLVKRRIWLRSITVQV